CLIYNTKGNCGHRHVINQVTRSLTALNLCVRSWRIAPNIVGRSPQLSIRRRPKVPLEIRRECVEHGVVFGARHLRPILLSSMQEDIGARTHLSLTASSPARATKAALAPR